MFLSTLSFSSERFVVMGSNLEQTMTQEEGTTLVVLCSTGLGYLISSFSQISINYGKKQYEHYFKLESKGKISMEKNCSSRWEIIA